MQIRLMFTNWTPVSLRIPIPADAKFAPTRSFSPWSSGLKYGNVDSEPKYSPASKTWKIKITWTLLLNFYVSKKNKNFTYNVRKIEAIREAAGRLMSRIVDAIRRRVCSSSWFQVVVIAIVNKRITKSKESFCLWKIKQCSYKQGKSLEHLSYSQFCLYLYLIRLQNKISKEATIPFWGDGTLHQLTPSYQQLRFLQQEASQACV